MAKHRNKKKSQIPSSQPHSSNNVALGLSTCSSRQSPLPSPLPPLDLDLQPSKSVNPRKTSLLPCWGNAPLAHEVTGHSNEVQVHKHAPPELSSSAEETEDEESSSSDYDSGSSGDSSDLDPEITPSCPVTTNGPPSHATPPRDAAEVPGNPKSSSAPIGQWRNLSASNRNSSVCSKLMHFSEVTAARKCNLLDEDLDIACDVWKSCLIGYVSGEFPGFKALNRIITNCWHCDAVLNIHDSGWLVYKFQNEVDKLVVLRGGPYLIYGRTLILKEMPEYFDFNSEEMSIVPVWIKLPNLPLKCWSSNCLSKIASVIGKPILSDKLTSSMARLSYARILVEIDIFNDLPQSINICLPNGCSLGQQVVYETLPEFCKHCRVPGHLLETCTKSPNVKGGDSAQGKDSNLAKETLVPGTVKSNKSSKGRRNEAQEVQPSVHVADIAVKADMEEWPRDPMYIEVAAAACEWETVKRKNQSNRNPKQTVATGGVTAEVGLVESLPGVVTRHKSRKGAKSIINGPNGNGRTPPTTTAHR